MRLWQTVGGVGFILQKHYKVVTTIQKNCKLRNPAAELVLKFSETFCDWKGISVFSRRNLRLLTTYISHDGDAEHRQSSAPSRVFLSSNMFPTTVVLSVFKQHMYTPFIQQIYSPVTPFINPLPIYALERTFDILLFRVLLLKNNSVIFHFLKSINKSYCCLFNKSKGHPMFENNILTH